jgi:colanic acid/amylovoran biosynthesis glycosyltransferase
MSLEVAAHPRRAAHRPVVAIFREFLLNYNEPYIRDQGEALCRYQSHYFGVRRVKGIDLPRERTLVLHNGGRVGRASEAVFKLFGVSPVLVRGLRQLRPALLHAHTGIGGAHVLPLARRLRVPLVVTFHGFEVTATDETLHRRRDLGRVFLRRRETMKREGHLFIAVSEFIRGRMLERGWPEERVALHYIGVDTERFRADPAVRREPVVLFVGRLIETKGVTHLVAAMRQVQARVPDAELVVVGRGPLQGDLERQAQDSGVRVRFVGVLPPEEVRAWMNRARAFCMPSVTASNGTVEALAIVALEAQAMGLPVVGSRSGGIPEAVADGQTGLLAPERDSATLAAHIEALLTDDVLSQRMSAAAAARVRERFDLRRQTARLEDLYDRARLVGNPEHAGEYGLWPPSPEPPSSTTEAARAARAITPVFSDRRLLPETSQCPWT